MLQGSARGVEATQRGDSEMAKGSRLTWMCLIVLAMTAATQAQSAREQLNQLVAQLQTTPTDDALREKIIKLAITIRLIGRKD
jgi:hypothetical protein